MSKWSGRVVFEMMHSSDGDDSPVTRADTWRTLVSRGDVYVGITAKPVCFVALQQFDPVRYAALSVHNPNPNPAGGKARQRGL